MKPIDVAIVGGGCAAMATAFELTRPEHGGRYRVTVYQQGFRLGGKGASGRGPRGRIEEHGLHIWMGFYENAFRLLRECYEELAAVAPGFTFAHFRDAFVPDSYIGVSDQDVRGTWSSWTSYFPPTDGSPGDPLDPSRVFSVAGYARRSLDLLGMLVRDLLVHRGESELEPPAAASPLGSLAERLKELLGYGRLATLSGVAQCVLVLGQVFSAAAPELSEPAVALLERLRSALRGHLESLLADDEQARRRFCVVDVMLAALRGILVDRLLVDPRGLDAINDHDFRDWLRMHGASETSLASGMLRGALYDLAFAYEDGDPLRPRFAAGEALRSCMRLFFTYRGAFFWKMRAGMGDVVFAPFYEALRRRGVRFRFFHRLENVRLGERDARGRGHVRALEFAVQAEVRDGVDAYRPLVDVRGLPSWPHAPDFAQLVDGERLRASGFDPESFWDTQRAATRTLEVGKDFDFAVLAVGLGAVPHVCKELVASDARYRDMVTHVKSVNTQAFQVWLRADLAELGYTGPSCSTTGFVKPFDTWADMPQLIDAEDWRTPPRSVAYFCNVLETPRVLPDDPGYRARMRAQVRESAVTFLRRDMRHFWPRASSGHDFRWELLAHEDEEGRELDEPRGAARFDSQFWIANVDPSERYSLSLPGSGRYRISPLDPGYDNFTVAGDWTACGLAVGCVEAAVMSGRLAAHALSRSPKLTDIIGYDHP